MNFNEYQEFCKSVAVYPKVGRGSTPEVVYCILGMNGEAGEAADHVKKVLRDDHGTITEDRRQAILREAGDVLWYVAMLAYELQVSLEDLAKANVLKLSQRQSAGTLHGGDEARARHYEEILERKTLPTALGQKEN